MENILKNAVNGLRSFFRTSNSEPTIKNVADIKITRNNSGIDNRSASAITPLEIENLFAVPSFSADEISICVIDESNQKFIKLLRKKSKRLNKTQKNQLIMNFCTLLMQLDTNYGTNRYLSLPNILKCAGLSYSD